MVLQRAKTLTQTQHTAIIWHSIYFIGDTIFEFGKGSKHLRDAFKHTWMEHEKQDFLAFRTLTTTPSLAVRMSNQYWLDTTCHRKRSVTSYLLQASREPNNLDSIKLRVKERYNKRHGCVITWLFPNDRKIWPSSTNEHDVNLFRSSEFAIFNVSLRYRLKKCSSM